MTDTLTQLEDALWALYASGIQPGDETEHASDLLNTLEDAYSDFLCIQSDDRGFAISEKICDTEVLSSIEAACEKIEASLPGRRFLSDDV